MSESKLVAQDIEYLDPLHCGSTLGYYIKLADEKNLYAEIDLADCNRKITWSFGDYGTTLESDTAKIATAIKLLTDFKKVYTKNRKAADKAKKDAESS